VPSGLNPRGLWLNRPALHGLADPGEFVQQSADGQVQSGPGGVRRRMRWATHLLDHSQLESIRMLTNHDMDSKTYACRENASHGSDQQSCSPAAMPAMINCCRCPDWRGARDP